MPMPACWGQRTLAPSRSRRPSGSTARALACGSPTRIIWVTRVTNPKRRRRGRNAASPGNPRGVDSLRPSLCGQLADELHRPLDPAAQLAIIREPLRGDQHPALHCLAGDVKRFDVRFSPRLLTLLRPEAGDQGVLPDAHAHVAVEEEAEATEHLPLRDALPPGQGCANACRQ